MRDLTWRLVSCSVPAAMGSRTERRVLGVTRRLEGTSCGWRLWINSGTLTALYARYGRLAGVASYEFVVKSRKEREGEGGRKNWEEGRREREECYRREGGRDGGKGVCRRRGRGGEGGREGEVFVEGKGRREEGRNGGKARGTKQVFEREREWISLRFHLSTPQICRNPLEGGSFFAKLGRPYCKNCV